MKNHAVILVLLEIIVRKPKWSLSNILFVNNRVNIIA